MAQSVTEGDAAARQGNQLLCCKSIDKLISEAESPEHRLSKTLGPWSLTALGIGAIIGSGIFILTGTAAAGEYFQAPSLLHAQALDVIVNFLRTGSTAGALMHGRPPAGPSIAISFLLVAIACSFAGLCYAELASMIPIAGSAYTYSYATLGEIFRLDHRLGSDSRIRSLERGRRGGFRRLHKSAAGRLRPQPARQMGESRLGRRGLDRLLLQSSRLPDRVPPHAAAGARSEGVGGDQQHHGRGQDRRHPDFSSCRRHAGKARELDALCALWLCRNRHRRRHRLLHLHRIRFGLHCRRGIAQSAKRFAFRHHHVAGRLHSLYMSASR